MPTFSCIFSSKGRYMTSKIKILGQKSTLWEGHFDHFGVQKSRFFDFLKVVLELFRSGLGIIFGLKMPPFSSIFSSKGWYMTSKIKILCQNWALWEGHLTIFRLKKPVFWGFWKLFWRCSEVVWALFSALKCPLLAVFSARKVDIWPLKSKFWVKNWPSDRVILTVLRAKKVVFWTFWKLFWRCSEVI